MKKEIVKNCILSLLIFVCVFLFYKIWFSEKLWSSDYNFFTVLWGGSPTTADTSSSIEDILRPKRIIFSGGGKRFVSTKGEDSFEDYYGEVKSVLSKISENDSKFIDSTEDEMISAIKSSSVIVDFGTVFGGEIGTFLGTYFPCERVKDVVISLNDSALGRPVVYIRDQATGKVLKTTVDMPLDSLLSNVAGHLQQNALGNIPFAFELGFNKSKLTADSEISQDILLDSNILMRLSAESAPGIIIAPPKDTDISSSQLTSLLRQFGMNKSSAKKYIETNDSVIYVSGGSTLKISPSGTLEYSSGSEGPVIYDPSSENALPSAVGNIFSYVRAVFRSFDINSPALQISSDLVNLSNNTQQVTITIDYYVNSVPVMAWENSHAITVTLKNGRLVSYKQQVCDITTTDEVLAADNMLQAVDKLYTTLPAGSKATVSDLFVAYTDEKNISWCAKLNGSDELIFIGKGATP